MVDIITAFNQCDKQSTGGVTGSYQVRGVSNNKLYQLKPSILDGKWIRGLKANALDRENFGEVIAASIAKALVFNGAPNVSLVYDKEKKRISIASEYLESTQTNGVRNLDEYAKEQGISIPKGKHVQFIKGKASTQDKQLGKMGLVDASSIDKKNFAETLALSAILGDHDINPGNMMAITETHGLRIVRIDFGHAFNDLLNAPEFLNGKLLDKQNPVMDYFNREKIAGIGGVAQSKMWRDYPGMLPTKELAKALCDLGKRAMHVKKAIKKSQDEFFSLIETLIENNDIEGCEHVIKSLIAIVNASHGKPFERINSNILDNIPVLFHELQQFIIKNCENANYVGRVMGLQAAVDEQITVPGAMHAVIANLGSHFSLNEQLENNQPIQWLKTAPETPAFFGSLQEYVIHRRIDYLKQQPLKTMFEKLALSLHETIKTYDQGKTLSTNSGKKSLFQSKQEAIHAYLNQAILCLDNNDLPSAKASVEALINYLEKTFGEKNFLGKPSVAYSLAKEAERVLNNPPSDEVKEMNDFLALFDVAPTIMPKRLSAPIVKVEKILNDKEKELEAFLAVLNSDEGDVQETEKPIISSKLNDSVNNTAPITHSFKQAIVNNNVQETEESKPNDSINNTAPITHSFKNSIASNKREPASITKPKSGA